MTNEEIQTLIQKYLTGKASKEEKEKLQEWYMKNTEGEVQVEVEALNANENEALLEASLYKKIQKEMQSGRAPVKKIWWAAAASIIVIAGVLGAVFTNNHQKVAPLPIAWTHDVPAPDCTRAVITLSNGNKLFLDSAGIGILAQQDNVNVVRDKDGAINYQLTVNSQGPIQYNTLFNPRGSKVISLTLSDGTKVWLNAESSLKYPTAFAGNSRKVEITGEAYFEVAHNTNRPFHVKKGSADIVVLGTNFNVNAYEDEDALRITLLEGSVRVSANNKAVTIKPGQQAVAGKNSSLTVDDLPDLDVVMAWKNGLFQMNNTDIATIMKQIARWYDVEIVYEKGIPGGQITGTVPRNTNLSNVLKILEYSGLHFLSEDRKIIVKN